MRHRENMHSRTEPRENQWNQYIIEENEAQGGINSIKEKENT